MSTSRYNSALQPKIDFHDMQHAWFSYAGIAYSVTGASSKVFRAAVLQKSPTWRSCAEYMAVLKNDELDRYDRWWLLNSLADARRGITLYDSREQAEGRQVG